MVMPSPSSVNMHVSAALYAESAFPNVGIDAHQCTSKLHNYNRRFISKIVYGLSLAICSKHIYLEGLATYGWKGIYLEGLCL
jgi:hypothetical protein